MGHPTMACVKPAMDPAISMWHLSSFWRFSAEVTLKEINLGKQLKACRSGRNAKQASQSVRFVFHSASPVLENSARMLIDSGRVHVVDERDNDARRRAEKG